MQITVIQSTKALEPDLIVDQTVIVIDVLRATSNMITALMYGCKEIIPLETVEEAKRLKVEGDLLGGERNCLKLPDFDLGNSPYEYMTPQVLDKRILMTTTNGTRVIQQANSAKYVLVGAFINARACALAAIELQEDIVILCAGTNDAFSWEDGLCAGLIVHELQQISNHTLQVNDFALCLTSSYLEAQSRLPQALLGCTNGKRLTLLGFESDILYCSKVNISDSVPILCDGMLIPQRSKNGCPS
jgi:2-phosphosulfolactate phosphatase